MIRIKKVKLHNNGNVEIRDNREIIDGPTRENEENIKKSSVVPHPDLLNSLSDLKPIIAECFGINYADEFIHAEGLSEDKEEAFKVVQPVLRREYKTILNRITITGISLSGDSEKRCVVITAKMEQPNNSKISMNSPNIRLYQSVFGFEEELSDLIDKVLVESELYHLGHKKAQLDMFESEIEGDSKMEAVA